MNIKFSALTKSHTDLVKSWVASRQSEKYIIVLYDPLSHPDVLKLLNLNHNSLQKLYESKVLVLLFEEIEETEFVFNSIINNSNIYGELYYRGHFITDTIEHEL